jgi:hypothetical protein
LHPHIQVFDGDKRVVANISVPTGGYLQVRDGDEVKEGDILIKIPRESSKAVILPVVFRGLQSFLKPASLKILQWYPRSMDLSNLEKLNAVTGVLSSVMNRGKQENTVFLSVSICGCMKETG